MVWVGRGECDAMREMARKRGWVLAMISDDARHRWQLLPERDPFKYRLFETLGEVCAFLRAA